MIPYPDLKAAALAATSSVEWEFLNRIGEIVFRVKSGNQAIFPLGRMHHELNAEVRANAAYIDAANPATILALIERLQVAEDAAKDAERYKWLRGPDQESTRYNRWRIEYWDGPNGWQPMQRECMDNAIDVSIAARRLAP